MAMPIEVNRRRLLQCASFGAVVASTAGMPAQLSAQLVTNKSVPLQHDSIEAAVVQSHVTANIGDNISSMLRTVERLQSGPVKHDLVAFHALAVQGRIPRSLDDARAMAINLRGHEVGTLRAAAKQHGTYISFAALTTDTEWPGQVIPQHVLLGPEGQIVLAAWQATTDPSLPFLTNTEAVLDRYITLYGPQAVLPVAHTSIGIIALASEHAAPEIFRVLAMKGAEIFIRCPFDSSAVWDVQACAAYNQCTTLAPGTAASLQVDSESDGAGLRGGGSVVVGPRGEMLAQAGSKWDQTLSVKIPLGHYRAGRPILNVHTSLTLPAYANAHDFA